MRIKDLEAALTPALTVAYYLTCYCRPYTYYLLERCIKDLEATLPITYFLIPTPTALTLIYLDTYLIPTPAAYCRAAYYPLSPTTYYPLLTYYSLYCLMPNA